MAYLPKSRALQSKRRHWKRFVDRTEEHRAVLHAHCLRLIGSVWDAEDLAQEALLRLFGAMARSDGAVADVRAYLLRTATHLWIDRVRREAPFALAADAQAVELEAAPVEEPKGEPAAIEAMFRILHPQERAALAMQEALDLSLAEIAAELGTTVGAVKSALHRARGRLLDRKPPAGFATPPRELVERFAAALGRRDLEAIRRLCDESVVGELVGGAELAGFKRFRKILEYAHLELPRLGFGAHPRWEVTEYQGEVVLLGFRTLDGVDGLNEVHRFELRDGRIARVRVYCFCPESLAVVASALGRASLPRPHRSPSWSDLLAALLGFRPSWRRSPSGKAAALP